MSDIDRDFTRFAQRGDAGALGRVYDASAAELLALATRLVGDPSEAEDLVQATFVAAIESAADFGAGRRLMPWLVGILNNRVRRWQRERQRQGRVPPPPRQPRDPADALAGQEFDARVAAALDRLPPVLRTVVVLRLRHGMQPAEIAYALQRPPGTVRSQLARGLAQVRERLPRSCALPAVLALPTTRGLAAVRTAVLAHGRVHAAGLAHATLLGGVLTMAKQTKLLGVLAATLFLGALAWWLPRTDDPQVDPPPPCSAATAALAAPGAEQPSGEPRAGKPARPQRARSPASTPQNELHVEVHHAETPLPGVSVRVQPARGPARHGTTDAGGRVPFEDLPPGRGHIRVFGTAVGCRFELAAEDVLVVSLETPRPGRVRGLVLHEGGDPAGGARVWISVPHIQKGAVDVLRAGADGTFELSVWHRAWIGARAPGTVPTHREVELAPGKVTDIVLHLRDGGAALVGTVVAAGGGRPLPGAVVEVGDDFGHYAGRLRPDGGRTSVVPFTAVTDEAGRFAVDGVLPGPVTVYARAPGYARGERRVGLSTGGRTEVVLTLDRGVVVRGVVTRSDDAPATGARVRWHDGTRRGARTAETDRKGRYELAHVPAGRVRLEAVMAGQGKATEHVRLEPGTIVSWSPTLDPHFKAIRGRVVDDRGEPLAGWWVLAHTDSPHDTGSPARVAADGRFALERLRERPQVRELRVHPPGDPGRDGRPVTHPVLARSGVRVGAREVVLEVPHRLRPTAWLRGKVVEVDGGPRSGPAWLGPRAAGALLLRGPTGTTRPLAADDDGTFDHGPLAPGRWEIVQTTTRARHCVRAAFDLLAGEARDAGTVGYGPVPYGGLSIGLERRAVHPDFAAEFDGAAAAQVLEAEGYRFVRWVTLQWGTTRVRLLPGRYLVRLAGAPLAPSGRACEVVAGETTTLTFDPLPAALRRVAFRHPGTDHPFEPLELEVRDESGTLVWNGPVRPRDGWWLSELNLVPGTYRLKAHTPGGLHAEASLSVEDADPGTRPTVLPLAPH